MCIDILEIHKLVLLQFHLLSDVVIDIALKMVRIGIENVAEITQIRGYIEAHCKLTLSVKSIHDEICIVYGDKQMSFFHSL